MRFRTHPAPPIHARMLINPLQLQAESLEQLDSDKPELEEVLPGKMKESGQCARGALSATVAW